MLSSISVWFTDNEVNEGKNGAQMFCFYIPEFIFVFSEIMCNFSNTRTVDILLFRIKKLTHKGNLQSYRIPVPAAGGGD